ncbi:hypothetical protein EDD21DRAFT_410049 [Dissophora ornata]|nr:hypothetical protein EDD21DRAFT_410049 [Dissophora ornata]
MKNDGMHSSLIATGQEHLANETKTEEFRSWMTFYFTKKKMAKKLSLHNVLKRYRTKLQTSRVIKVVPPRGLAIFGSLSFKDETKLLCMDFQGVFRLQQFDLFIIPLGKRDFGNKTKATVISCPQLAARLPEPPLPGALGPTDSDLEAFRHNPTNDSFGPLLAQAGPNTNYPDEVFLSY